MTHPVGYVAFNYTVVPEHFRDVKLSFYRAVREESVRLHIEGYHDTWTDGTIKGGRYNVNAQVQFYSETEFLIAKQNLDINFIFGKMQEHCAEIQDGYSWISRSVPATA